MTQKFYLHDATTGDLGTLPSSATLSATSPNVTATGAGTNRAMDGAIGFLQTSASLTTLAVTSAQKNWARRFVSGPLAAGTYGSGTWTFSDAQSESNAASNLFAAMGVWFWRPSTGAKVGTVLDITQTTQTEPGTSESARSGTVTGSNVTILDGDILVVEIWGFNTQGAATARTNTWFYDGTTEASITTNAAFIQAPADIPLSGIFLRSRVSKNQASGINSIVLTKPTGVVAGDVMYAAFYSNNNQAVPTLAGWTQVANKGDGSTNLLTVLRRVADGTEGASFTFAGGAGQSVINGAVVALVGVDNTTPEDATATATSSTGASVVAPTITTVTDKAWHMPIFVTDGAQTSLSQPTGYDNDVPTYGSAGDLMRVDSKLITPAGATGTVTSTAAGTAGAWLTVSLAVRPASTASNVTVTPGVLALALTEFAPTVVTPRLVTPGVLALTLSEFAPTVRLGVKVIPGVIALGLTTFAPTVKTPRLVVPGALSLTLTGLAPKVLAGVTVKPGTLALTLTEFAPTVAVTNNQKVTPGLLALTLTKFAPTVAVPRLVAPGVQALSLSTFAPTVTKTSSVTVSPATLALLLGGYAPTVARTGAQTTGSQPRPPRRKPPEYLLDLLLAASLISEEEYVVLNESQVRNTNNGSNS